METFFAVMIVLVATAAAVTGLFVVRKKVSFDTLSEHHEVANPMVTIVATLYSVLLGFLVVCSFNRFDGCRAGVQTEANALGDVFHLASGLPSATKIAIHSDCISYAQSVIGDDFPAMSHGLESKQTGAVMDRLWNDCLTFAPATSLETGIHGELLASVKAVYDRRQIRLFELNIGLWPILWAVLIVGNAILVGFTYFFAMKNLASQMIMVGLLAFLLSINVYLVIDFSSPFDGPISVSPSPMLRQLKNFQERVDLK